MSLRERFDRHLAAMALPPGTALVAVSGGPDSLALLDLLAGSSSAGGLTLHVAHADHGIHSDSGRVGDSVSAAAARYGLPVHVSRLCLGPDSGETAARAARYTWLNRLADELGAELIFTAHHQDDQVETILMRLLKGSGPAGLAGMAPRRGRVLRPLLPFRRVDLAEHLHSLGVSGWEDPANSDPRHQRSWIRAEILPALRQRAPDIDRRLLSLGRQAASERAAWDALLERLPDLDFRVACDGVSVAASPLHGYDWAVLRALLGALGRRADCIVGPRRAARIERLLARGRSGSVAELGGGCAAELSFGRLRLFRGGGAAHPSIWERRRIDGNAGDVAVGGWRLVWQEGLAPDRLERNLPSSWFTDGSYVVRPWRAGDRIRPLGGIGRRLVVRCMQDAQIARSRRAAWPVVEAAGVGGGTIVWVPGVCRSADRLPAPGSPALRIDAHLA